jgi:hypothetical protein
LKSLIRQWDSFGGMPGAVDVAARVLGEANIYYRRYVKNRGILFWRGLFSCRPFPNRHELDTVSK